MVRKGVEEGGKIELDKPAEDNDGERLAFLGSPHALSRSSALIF
jgi:hypothetical protein